MSKNHKFPNNVESTVEIPGIKEVVSNTAPEPEEVPPEEPNEPNMTYSVTAIGIGKDKSGRFHLFEVIVDPNYLLAGKVKSLYSDMLEEEMREKFAIEASRRNFQWQY